MFSKSVVLFIGSALFIFSTLFQECVAETVILPIQREDGSIIRAYFDSPEDGSYPIVISIKGSSCGTIEGLHNYCSELFLQHGFGVLSLEKQGVRGPTIDHRQYDKTDSFTRRLDDHLLCVDMLRNGLVDGWNGEIIIFGASEGGVIGGALASMASETKAIILMCTGGGLSFREEEMILLKKSEREGDEDYEAYKEFYNQMLDQAVETPVSYASFRGKSFKWWASHLAQPPLVNAMLKVDCPIFYVHGTEDKNIPIESADAFAESFKNAGKDNLHYLRLEGYDHAFNVIPQVDPEKKAVEWLLHTLPKGPEE